MQRNSFKQHVLKGEALLLPDISILYLSYMVDALDRASVYAEADR